MTTAEVAAERGFDPALGFDALRGFDPALRGQDCVLESASGELFSLPANRWHGPPDRFDRALLARCAGPTVDIGCGPGRLAGALGARGTPVLGLDISPVAVRMTRARGVRALQADVFGPVPAEGRWRHGLLVDGNIGIGGDPIALLRRVAELLARNGTVLVELARPGTGLRRSRVRVRSEGHCGQWFPWAWLGVDSIGAMAVAAGLLVRGVQAANGRWFAELLRV